MFTSGIVSVGEGHRIALFFTGVRHAGENLTDLKRRSQNLPPPMQMCDGLDHNLSKEFQTLLCPVRRSCPSRFCGCSGEFPAGSALRAQHPQGGLQNRRPCAPGGSEPTAETEVASGRERAAYAGVARCTGALRDQSAECIVCGQPIEPGPDRSRGSLQGYTWRCRTVCAKSTMQASWLYGKSHTSLRSWNHELRIDGLLKLQRWVSVCRAEMLEPEIAYRQ